MKQTSYTLRVHVTTEDGGLAERPAAEKKKSREQRGAGI